MLSTPKKAANQIASTYNPTQTPGSVYSERSARQRARADLDLEYPLNNPIASWDLVLTALSTTEETIELFQREKERLDRLPDVLWKKREEESDQDDCLGEDPVLFILSSVALIPVY